MITTASQVSFRSITDRVSEHTHGPALVADGSTIDYPELNRRSRRIADRLLALRGTRDLDEARVAFLVPPGANWVAVALGVWRAGGIAVPLALSHPEPELEYVIRDAEAAVVVADDGLESRLQVAASGAGAAFDRGKLDADG